jgi:hypothetical protein
MPGRGRTTHNKRLKEQKRAEKRQEKETRRQLRKLGVQTPGEQDPEQEQTQDVEQEQTPPADATDDSSEQVG